MCCDSTATETNKQTQDEGEASSIRSRILYFQVSTHPLLPAPPTFLILASLSFSRTTRFREERQRFRIISVDVREQRRNKIGRDTRNAGPVFSPSAVAFAERATSTGANPDFLETSWATTLFTGIFN